MPNDKEYYTLREVAIELDLSEIWVRRMLTKKVGLLGGKGVKIEGTWRIPTQVVESLKNDYDEKRETTLKRKRGEIPKYQFVYTPDRVKACRITPILLKEYENDLSKDEFEKIVKILHKIELEEVKLYEDRKRERNVQS